MNPGLEAAVSAGVIDRATAVRLEPYLASGGVPLDTVDPDDEKLRLITGFNDIFVTIGLVLFLGALGFLASGFGGGIPAFVVAAAAFALAEFFTRVKRLALPSIVLLVIFVGSVFTAVLNLQGDGGLWVLWHNVETPVQMMVAGAAAMLAAMLHWWRFHVPITIAAGTAAFAALLLGLCGVAAPTLLQDYPLAVFLPLGLAIFALAMWFDMSDLKRQTRRTDVAFWLHLLAAPIIVHPILMPIIEDRTSTMAAALVIGVFIVLAAVALIVDRRAILVSSLFYLAYAAGMLITAAGLGSSSSFAMSALAVGAIVLMLSAAWVPLRRVVMGLLPATLRERLPRVA